MRRSYLIAAALSLASPLVALAQEPTAESIRCKLDPACTTPKSRCGMYRCIDVIDGKAASKHNAVDLNVAFGYSSAILEIDARITLDNLGKALADPRLASYAFLIGGHTDAKGGAAYNRVLSRRRAQAVRDYLVTHFDLAASRFTVKGFGSEQLVDPVHPLDGVNRRVQIVNTTEPTPR